MFKVLIAEDNIELSDMMRNYLIKSDFTVYQAFDGKEAINIVDKLHPDILLLDLMLPVIDGYEVCRTIRTNSSIPIIVISAKAKESDKIDLLELGADDYMTKPFSYREMVSRINAHLRRYFTLNQSAVSTKRVYGKLTVDSEHMQALFENQPLPLTAKEFKILDLLTLNKNVPFTKQQIIDNVWGIDAYIDENTVTVTIARLREKLAKVDISNITNIWGIGYKWQE